jgi:hypothetical protein
MADGRDTKDETDFSGQSAIIAHLPSAIRHPAFIPSSTPIPAYRRNFRNWMSLLYRPVLILTILRNNPGFDGLTGYLFYTPFSQTHLL